MPRSVSVKDYMSTNLLTFTPDADVQTAIHDLVANQISGAPVVDDNGNLVGMLSERDCLKVALSSGYNAEPGGKVAEYMSQPVESVSVDTSIFEVAEKFINGRYHRYPVLDENRLVGQISRSDVLKALEQLSI